MNLRFWTALCVAISVTVCAAGAERAASSAAASSASGILIEAERFDARHPDDSSFAGSAYSPYAYGTQTLARFFTKDGRCTYRFRVETEAVYTLWLRYASNRDQRIGFLVDGDGEPDGKHAARAPLSGTGSLSGPTAWNWARLGEAGLEAGEHRLTLFASSLRPDCIWISRRDAPPDDRKLAAERLRKMRFHLENPIEPIAPDWLAEADRYELPAWYDGIRVCAHTRLGWPWRERRPELFLGVGGAFASLGFREYSRHVKSGSEPAWWPSAVGAVQPEAREVNYARKIIDDAHRAGCRILVYHRHMEDAHLAETHPEWAARDHRGNMTSKRGPKLCFNTPYAGFVETRLVELAKMGADGFYFDEVHMPKPFCWCENCRRAFEAETGIEYPAEPDPFDPAFQKAVEFKNVTIERLFRRWRKAIHAVNPEIVLLIASNTYPMMVDRHTTHRLWRIADSMKTEFSLPDRASANRIFAVDETMAPTESDARLALGYAIARDACDGRPPHVWTHGLPNAAHARFATAGLIAHGAIANLDHSEATIPDPELFSEAVALGNRIAPAFAGTRPLRWAAVHFSEHARDHYLPDEALAWKSVLYPVYGAFTTLLRARLPVGIVTDGQLEQGRLEGYRVLFLPAPAHLTGPMQQAVERFRREGGLVVAQKPGWDWHQPEGGMAAVGKRFLDEIAPALPSAPVRVTGGPEKMHAIPFADSRGRRITVALVNDFSWVFTGSRRTRQGEPIPGVEERINRPPPPPCQGVTVHVRRRDEPVRVYDAATGKPLEATPAGAGLRIDVPTFDCVSVVVVECPSRDE